MSEGPCADGLCLLDGDLPHAATYATPNLEDEIEDEIEDEAAA